MAEPEDFITFNALLLALNTTLILVCGFLLRDAWNNIHKRIDILVKQDTEKSGRLIALETVVFDHPRRRKRDYGDDDPNPQEKQ